MWGEPLFSAKRRFHTGHLLETFPANVGCLMPDGCRRVFWFGLAVLFFTTATAQACSSRVDDGLSTFPGYGILGQYVGFVLPILAGFLERPFVSWAGISRRALPLSMQGSILSAGVSAVGGYMIYTQAHRYFSVSVLVLFWGWVFGSIVLAAVIKQRWLMFRTNGAVSVGRLLLGSVFSSLVIFFLPLYQVALGADKWVGMRWIWRNEFWWVPLTFYLCIAIYLVSFLFRGEAATHHGHGFAVISKNSLRPVVSP